MSREPADCGSPYLGVPVLVEVVDAGDAAPVPVGVIHVLHVVSPLLLLDMLHMKLNMIFIITTCPG